MPVPDSRSESRYSTVPRTIPLRRPDNFASARQLPLGMRTLPLLLLLLFNVVQPVHAKRRNRNRNTAGPDTVQHRKRECEIECKDEHDDDRSNCVLRCQSEACYQEIYMPEELEPGEIDLRRQRQFQACLSKEVRDAMATRGSRRNAEATAEASTTPSVADSQVSDAAATASADAGRNAEPQMEL